MSSPDPKHAQWFAENVRPHEPALRNWLRYRFPVLGDPDDLLQETYARVWQLRDRRPDQVTVVKPLLFTTAHNLAVDLLRRRRVASFEALPEAENETPEDAPPVPEIVSRRQELELLKRAMQSLPERCRQVLTLRKIYGLSQKHIAAQLGISEHTVEAQVGIGMRRCAEFLARFGLP